MQKISRRQLAKYAVDELVKGISSAVLAKHLGAVLVSTKRANQGEQLIEDVRFELEARGLWTRGVITTAFPLDNQLKTELDKFIRNSSKVNAVEINEIIDKTVIGGIRIDTAGRSWDHTIKRRLTDIREAF